MVWPLTVEVWLLAGRTLPSYERTAMPTRLLRNVRDDWHDED